MRRRHEGRHDPLVAGLGIQELMLLLAVLVLLFGASKLPELARSSGRALRIFKAETKGMIDDDEVSEPQKTQEQHRWLGVPVELLDRLAGTEPGGTDPQLGTGCVPCRDLTSQDRGEVLLVGPPGVTRVVGQPTGCFSDPGRLQRTRQIGQLLERLACVADTLSPGVAR